MIVLLWISKHAYQGLLYMLKSLLNISWYVDKEVFPLFVELSVSAVLLANYDGSQLLSVWNLFWSEYFMSAKQPSLRFVPSAIFASSYSSYSSSFREWTVWQSSNSNSKEIILCNKIFIWKFHFKSGIILAIPFDVKKPSSFTACR